MNVLVTGGAGFIGSHTCVALLGAGHRVVVTDTLRNSSRHAIRAVERLSGQSVTLAEDDVRDGAAMERLLRQHRVDAVIHFAGLKSVPESATQPLEYMDVNVGGTVHLLDAMERAGVRRLVFSSSATVYGGGNPMPLKEDMPLSVTNPYGRSKLMVEWICRDLCAARPAWHVVLLRYFNPVGAHPSGQLGEDPRGVPGNLMPYLMQVAVGRRERLTVYGQDYPTPDGTGVRDYIHVMDLAEGHVAALQRLEGLPGCTAINLGTGTGISVMQLVQAASQAVGRPIPYVVGPRRPGDVAECYADATLAERLLGFRTRRTLMDMCVDAWNWQRLNPSGFPAERS